MKRLLVIGIIIQYASIIQTVNAQDINWVQKSSWEEIKSQAKENDKFIFVDCYATWCAPCKQMDKEVYTNDSVADLFNDHFVSIKLQMDSTKKDDENIKKMYDLVRKIHDEYQVQGFPSLLFFSSDGVLLNRQIGFINVPDLVKIAKETTSPERTGFYKQLESYKAGLKYYPTMMGLAVFTANVLKDRILSKQIASDYVAHVNRKELLNVPSIYFVRDVARDFKKSEELAKEYLLTIPFDSLMSEVNLRFISNYSQVIELGSPLFQILKNDSVKLDNIMGFKGWTKVVLTRIVTRQELENRLIRDGKPILTTDPNWNDLTSIIKSKYNFIDTDKLMLEFQIYYYRRFEDWQKWASYKDQRITKYPLSSSDGVGISLELNDGGAWDAFLNCKDKKVLTKALSWIDLAIKLKKTENPKGYLIWQLDTKANVLYKIGRTSEAIKTEKEAIRQIKMWAKEAVDDRPAKLLNAYNEVLQKMKEGKPTYVEQGAKW